MNNQKGKAGRLIYIVIKFLLAETTARKVKILQTTNIAAPLKAAPIIGAEKAHFLIYKGFGGENR